MPDARSGCGGGGRGLGCGEGGDAIWLAGRTDWWQVDARSLAAGDRSYDLVTSHFLPPPDGGMVEVAGRLGGAVAPGGHLLVVGQAPFEAFTHLCAGHRDALFLAEDPLPGLPDGFDALVAEQRPAR